MGKAMTKRDREDMSIDEMIKATKICTKSLMRLSYIDFQIKENQKMYSCKISNKNILKIDRL